MSVYICVTSTCFCLSSLHLLKPPEQSPDLRKLLYFYLANIRDSCVQNKTHKTSDVWQEQIHLTVINGMFDISRWPISSTNERLCPTCCWASQLSGLPAGVWGENKNFSALLPPVFNQLLFLCMASYLVLSADLWGCDITLSDTVTELWCESSWQTIIYP